MQLLKTYSRQRPTLPGTGVPSTIGVGELNFCVRDGNRCGLSAIATRKLMILSIPFSGNCLGILQLLRACALGQALDLLVPVSFRCCHPSTPGLSTSSSIWSLTSLCCGKSHLEAGFALRCFQRLSLPNIATRLCRWHDNRYTSGSSIPVLSY